MALVWLLDLSLGGRTLRASTMPVVFGGRRYTGAIDEVSMVETLALGSAPSAREASIDLLPEVDMAELVSQAHTLTAGRATLRLWDTTEAEYLAEVVMLDARCSLPEFGAVDEPLSFTLSAEAFDDTASLIPPSAAISESTWPTAPDDSVGQSYPLIWGAAGTLTGRVSDEVPASVGYAVETLLDEDYNFDAAATSSNQATLTSGTGELLSHMEVLYEEHTGGGFGLTDGDTYYVEEAAANVYRLYEDEDLRTVVTLSGTPSGVETLTITQPYATTVLVQGRATYTSAANVYHERPDGELFPAQSYSVTKTTDGLGRTVSVIDVTAWGVGRPGKWAVQSRLVPLYVAWPDAASYGTTFAGRLRYVGELLADLGHLASVPVDVGSLLSIGDDLQIPVGLVLTEDERPSDLLLRIARGLPLGLYAGPRGLTAVYLPSGPDRRSAVTLIDGRSCHRASGLSLVNEPDDMVTSISVDYAPNVYTDQSFGSVSMAADPLHPVYLGAATASSDVYIRSSAIAQDEDVEQALTEALDWTYASATAQTVARWLSRQSSVSPRTLSIDVPQTIARRLHLGHAVSLTSADLHITEALGFVSQREMSSAELWRLEIYFLHGVASDQAVRPTGASSTAPPEPST